MSQLASQVDGDRRHKAPSSDPTAVGSCRGRRGSAAIQPATLQRVRKLCADDSPASARELIELAHNSKDDRVRYMASTWVIERGVGKARDHSQDGESVMDLTRLSEAERRTLLELMSRVLGVEMPK